MIQFNLRYEEIYNPDNIDQESKKLLEEGHEEILPSDCNEEYGY